MVTHGATLDVPHHVVRNLVRLPAAHRRRTGTPRGSRAPEPLRRAVLVLRRFRARGRVHRPAREAGISRATAHHTPPDTGTAENPGPRLEKPGSPDHSTSTGSDGTRRPATTRAPSDRKMRKYVSEHRIGTVMSITGGLLSPAGAAPCVPLGPGLPASVTGFTVPTTGLVMAAAEPLSPHRKATMSVIRHRSGPTACSLAPLPAAPALITGRTPRRLCSRLAPARPLGRPPLTRCTTAPLDGVPQPADGSPGPAVAATAAVGVLPAVDGVVAAPAAHQAVRAAA